MIHDSVAAIPLIGIHKRREYAGNINDFFFGLLLSVGAFPVVIAIVAFIHGVSDIVRNGFCRPFAAALRGNIVIIKIIPDFTGRLCFFIHGIDKPGGLNFFRVMFRELFFRIPLPPVRHTGAVPFPFMRPPDHNILYALGSQFSFQFSKHKNNFQYSFTDRGRSVELFI